MTPEPCHHYEHTDLDQPAVWRVLLAGEDLGSYCTAHLGDAVDDFESTLTLERIG